MLSHQSWKSYCELHAHNNKEKTWNCDHILGKQLFKNLFGNPEYKKLKTVWNSPLNKQALPPHANTCAGLLCQRAWFFLDEERQGQGGPSSAKRCHCLDCVLVRMRQGKSLNHRLQQGLKFLQNPVDGSLLCYKSSLCQSLRDLKRQYPQYKEELERVKKRIQPLVCCRYGEFSSFCTRCALPRSSFSRSFRQGR